MAGSLTASRSRLVEDGVEIPAHDRLDVLDSRFLGAFAQGIGGAVGDRDRHHHDDRDRRDHDERVQSRPTRDMDGRGEGRSELAD
jgi:hypothetical protein